jgi:hypothetical protein
MWHSCQIFNEFNAREPEEKNVFRGVTRNHLFMAIVGITTVLQVTVKMHTCFDEAQVGSSSHLADLEK